MPSPLARVHVVVVAEGSLAFLPLGKTSIVATAVARAREAACRPTVSVWVAAEAEAAFESAARNLLPDCEIEVGQDLFSHASRANADIVLLHDAQRPLTESQTFDRVVAAIRAGATAARPAHVVVDTLKVVDEGKRVVGTVNRDTVQSLTSPEGYLKSAMRTEPKLPLWSFGVEPDRREFVRGDQESLKVREPADVLLVESFLAWQVREAAEARSAKG